MICILHFIFLNHYINILKTILFLLSVILLFRANNCAAQQDTASGRSAGNDKNVFVPDSSKQRDLIDFLEKLLNQKAAPDARAVAKKVSFSVVPSVSYSLTTGYQADLTANAGFYTTKKHTENYSEITGDLTIDTKDQKISVFRSEVWFADNQFKLVTDSRFERFPEDTYGLGTLTNTNGETNPITFNYVRSYVTFYKKLSGDFYAGVGYDLDYHYGVTQSGNSDGTVSDFTKYGYSPSSTSAGVTVNLLFDNRKNLINPLNGGFASIIYRQNEQFLGSNSNWKSLQFDLRKYIKVSPEKNNNILALWGLFWFSNGNVPYLDLPGTGQDMFNNSGRGYIQGRFLGQNMLYAESEYRFGITANGLLGAVVFVNAESLSEFPDNTFKKIAPAAGTGLRIKMNKHSNTNICIDYAQGLNNSGGFFLNLGEVF